MEEQGLAGGEGRDCRRCCRLHVAKLVDWTVPTREPGISDWQPGQPESQGEVSSLQVAVCQREQQKMILLPVDHLKEQLETISLPVDHL